MTSGTIGLALLLSGVGVAAQSDQRAILTLFANEAPHGATVVVLRASDVLVPVRALTGAGLQDFAGRRELIERQQYVSLSSLAPDVEFTVDVRALTLRLIANPLLFATTTLLVEDARPADLVYSRTPSAFVNYGLTWQSASGPSAFFETAGSLGTASLTSTFAWISGARPVRGLTTLTTDRRTEMQRWSAGDVIIRAGPFDAGDVIAGLSVSRDYGLDPVLSPLPVAHAHGHRPDPFDRRGLCQRPTRSHRAAQTRAVRRHARAGHVRDGDNIDDHPGRIRQRAGV